MAECLVDAVLPAVHLEALLDIGLEADDLQQILAVVVVVAVGYTSTLEKMDDCELQI